jgi:hypothetical protein
MLLLLSLACTYTAEDYWKDLAEVHCRCSRDAEEWRDCRAELMDVYEDLPYWEACHDDPAPLGRTEVRAWAKDATENCREPDEPLDEPADPLWFESCEG